MVVVREFASTTGRPTLAGPICSRLLGAKCGPLKRRDGTCVTWHCLLALYGAGRIAGAARCALTGKRITKMVGQAFQPPASFRLKAPVGSRVQAQENSSGEAKSLWLAAFAECHSCSKGVLG